MERLTVILKANKENIKKAANALKKGRIIIYPTESSYAIGCDFTNKDAIDEIFRIKKRRKSKKMITIVPDAKTAKNYGKINEVADFLMKKFMPGPLTLVVPGKRRHDKFRFRLSSNPIASKLAKTFGKPIVATSANISGKENIYSSNELEDFFGKVDLILDAGNLPKSRVSTVLEVKDNKIKIHREGAISKQKIKSCIK